MVPMLIALVALTGLVGLILLVALVVAYNGLVRLRNGVQEAWAQIDVALKRRHDLIPNLVETVKGYAGHERGTLEAVIAARSAAVNAHGAAEQSKAEGQLSGALGRLMLLVEQYPQLKANENFLGLQQELAGTENGISQARGQYNGEVRTYNTRREQIPTNIVAGLFNFKAAEYFEIEEAAEREAPKVKF